MPYLDPVKGRALAEPDEDAHICEICGSRWRLRYEGVYSVGYCPTCCPEEERKRFADPSPAKGET
jgi:hypothetical protein